MRAFILLVLVSLFSLSLFADEAPPAPAKTVEAQRLDTIKFGTETEIAALIQTLKTENTAYLDNELITLAKNTRNKNIVAGIFTFFADRENSGLEDRAMKAIEERDEEANETVAAAVDYLGKVKAEKALDALKALIDAGESRFLNAAFRALGRAGAGKKAADETAEYLLDYYNERNPNDENRREIITALGETGSKKGVPFLSELVENNEERAALRMVALGSLSKIADPSGLKAVIAAVNSTDPNVRSAAMAALGPFSGDEVDTAILEGFRDSYYRTRLAAAEAAKQRKLAAAIPYLRYRAERDDVPAVKDESVRALGAIGNKEALGILEELFSERRNADRVRILAAEMLVQNNADNFAAKVTAELDEAKSKNQTPLYNGFLRVLGQAKTGRLEDLARRFLSSGGITEKSYALDLVVNNEFRSLEKEVRILTDEKKGNPSLARKAALTLEKLGL